MGRTLSTSANRFCQTEDDLARLAIRPRALRYSAITASKSPLAVADLHPPPRLQASFHMLHGRQQCWMTPQLPRSHATTWVPCRNLDRGQASRTAAICS